MAWKRHREPALHVEAAGSAEDPVGDDERVRRERAERPHRVVVREDEHLRLAAEAPPQVGDAVDDDPLGIGAEQAGSDPGDDIGRAGDRRVVRRR